MPTPANTITNTVTYPPYPTKTSFLTDLRQQIEIEAKGSRKLLEILHRLSNTDTGTWSADSTARHDS